jgi:hypothetical protein
MTQLSAMPTVSKLALHRETVLRLAGQPSGDRRMGAISLGALCTVGCTMGTCGACTATCYTCAKHCTKKSGGCLA